jgi:hypothetical protein
MITEKMARLFSDNNSPFIVENIDLSMVASSEPAKPWPLVRQTNDWINYFGDYPNACAEIIDGNIQASVGRTGKYITRHVLQVPVNADPLRIYPTNREVSIVQREVRDKVERIYEQLEIFAENGLFTWKKTTGGAEIVFQGETIIIHFKLCQETNMFHALISKCPRMVRELIYPEMDNISSLIYCIRMIFVTPGLFVSFDFELSCEDIQQASVVTFELSIVPPREDPEWFNEPTFHLIPGEGW